MNIDKLTEDDWKEIEANGGLISERIKIKWDKIDVKMDGKNPIEIMRTKSY